MKQREEKVPAIDKPRLKQAIERLVQLYELTGAADQANVWKERLAESDRAAAEGQAASPNP